MRYEFTPGESMIFVRLHAFLHKATAEADRVRGWFEVEGDDFRSGVSGEAMVGVDDFVFGNALLARTAKQWINERQRSDLHFAIGTVTESSGGVIVEGQLTIGDRTESIEARATVDRSDESMTISGTWTLSQKRFGLKAPPGVKDAVDVEFRLVAAATR